MTPEYEATTAERAYEEACRLARLGKRGTDGLDELLDRAIRARSYATALELQRKREEQV